MVKHYEHRNEGTCSASVEFSVEDGIVKGVSFSGGCSGNLLGLSALVEGMEIGEAARRLSGIRCGESETSCPDQLA
jgi:uncharacterized protein (TIGR03905 family)